MRKKIVIFLSCAIHSLMLRSSGNTHLTNFLASAFNTLHVACYTRGNWSGIQHPIQSSRLARTVIPFPLGPDWAPLREDGVAFIFIFCHHHPHPALHPACNRDFNTHWNAYHVPDTQDTKLSVCENQFKKVNSHSVTESAELCDFWWEPTEAGPAKKEGQTYNAEPYYCTQPLPYLRSFYLMLKIHTYRHIHTYHNVHICAAM